MKLDESSKDQDVSRTYYEVDQRMMLIILNDPSWKRAISELRCGSLTGQYLPDLLSRNNGSSGIMVGVGLLGFYEMLPSA